MSYPKLYSANEAAKSNAFQTLGVGALGDAISCTVTEERNGEFELEMEYPVDGIHFNDIAVDMLIVAKSSDKGNEQIFRIYKIEKPIDGTVTVSAEHISYLLNRVACLPFTATSAQLGFDAIKENLQWKTDDGNFPTFPFSFWTDNNNEGTANIESPTMVRSCLGGVDGSLLNAFKGEFEFDNFTVKLWKDRGSDNSIYLRYGKNITDLTATDDISSSYTGILPYWKGNLTNVTGKDDNNNDVTESVETIVYLNDKLKWSEHADSYAYPVIKIVDMSSDIKVQDDTSDSDNPVYATADDVRVQLQTLADSYITDNKGWEPSSNIEVSFAQLWQTEEYKDVANLQRVGLCDTVHVIYDKLNVIEDMKVIKTVYNTLLERYDSMELGEATSSMISDLTSNTYATKQDVDEVGNEIASGISQAKQEAAVLLNGKLSYLSGEKGGYVVFDKDADGSIKQILVMNTPDKSTATKVWVWNQYGFGYMNGYGAESASPALTIDGQIVADLIKVGTIADGIGNFYLNMQTGDLVMKNGKFTGQIICGKTSHDNWSGNGLYADSTGISIGQADAWQGVPVFSVSTANGTSSPVRTTGIGFRHSDGTDFGYFYAWGTTAANGEAITSGHLLDSGKGKGCSFNGDMALSGRFFANGISSSGPLDAAGNLQVGGGGETNINKLYGGAVNIGKQGDGSILRIVPDYGIDCKFHMYMNGYKILKVQEITYSSDRRLKKDIETIDAADAMNFVMQLRPVKYRMKSDEEHLRFGFIAQEVKEIDDEHSELVMEDGSEYLNLNYTDMIADLVKVVQEQEKRIRSLEARAKGAQE